eukprot:3078003-Alexandrium_andersonii.AAC.1
MQRVLTYVASAGIAARLVDCTIRNCWPPSTLDGFNEQPSFADTCCFLGVGLVGVFGQTHKDEA